MDNKPTYRQLIVTFLKIGAFIFVGGYAMISLIENELKEAAALSGMNFTSFVKLCMIEKLSKSHESLIER